MKFTRHSGLYTLETEQQLYANAEVVWHFFSNPCNLEKLCPNEIICEITSPSQTDTYPGQIITYKIKPFRFFKMNWVTEITRVHVGYYFVDEQRFGPFKMWHHEHFFENVAGGILMKDKVTFKLPWGFIGRLAFTLVIKRRLEAIFTHRAIAAGRLFSQKKTVG